LNYLFIVSCGSAIEAEKNTKCIKTPC